MRTLLSLPSHLAITAQGKNKYYICIDRKYRLDRFVLGPRILKSSSLGFQSPGPVLETPLNASSKLLLNVIPSSFHRVV